MTFKMPAAAPAKKNITVNQGLLSNQLSKINPIIEPTKTAATISVLNFRAVPKDEVFFLLLVNEFLLAFFFAIFRRVLNSLNFFI